MIALLALAALALAAGTAPAADGNADDSTVAQRIVNGARDAEGLYGERRLEIGCSAPIDSSAITFIRRKKGPVLLAVINAKALRDVRRDWTENPRMQDWALIHDTDRDGAIDQMVFNIGPLPMEPVNATHLPSISSKELSDDAFQAWLDNSRTAYWQALDINRDGQLDRVAFPAKRKDNGWYSGWVVLGMGADEGLCRVIDRNGADKGGCSPSADGTQITGETVTADRWVARPQVVFDAFRTAAQSCRLGTQELRP